MGKTYMAKKEELDKEGKRNWYIVDAEDTVLGRLASKIAEILQGKHKPIYTPHVDTGDYVVVINAGKIIVTGSKLEQKIYRKYSGYPGGMREVDLEHTLRQKPTVPLELAVKRMLPKNKLGRKMFKKLKIYGGQEHPHKAQDPEPLEI